MTATERLRQLLDERGVDYRVSATGYSIDIGQYTTAYANRSDTTLDVSLRQVTPEQAVAATLGRGTCRMCKRKGYDREHLHHYECSECGEEVLRSSVMGESDPPTFCPECGRRVVS